MTEQNPGVQDKNQPRVQTLVDEGNAFLDEIDALNEREDKERTMGSMALTSLRSDLFQRAMGKFREAMDLDQEDIGHEQS